MLDFGLSGLFSFLSEEESKCKSKKNLFDDKWCKDQAAVNWCTKYSFFMKRNCAKTCCEAENQIRKNRAAGLWFE